MPRDEDDKPKRAPRKRRTAAEVKAMRERGDFVAPGAGYEPSYYAATGYDPVRAADEASERLDRDLDRELREELARSDTDWGRVGQFQRAKAGHGDPPPPRPPPRSPFNDFITHLKGLRMERSHFILLLIVATIFALIALVYNAMGTVHTGSYVIKQAAVSGELSAIMQPGMYGKWFATVYEWPVSETFDFTSMDATKGDKIDDSIEVRYNDGAVCRIGGTCRVDLPRTDKDAIALMATHGFRTWTQVEDKLLLPTIRRALIMTANLMTSKESYSNRRGEFYVSAWDQVENGLYQTKDEQVVDVDPISGQEIKRMTKAILKGPDGKVLREKNPLDGMGLRLSNFEIKNFVYEPKVQEQISKQQDAIMAVQTARAGAQKAQQDAITAEALGKADVMKAKYTQEVEKTKAEVVAEQERSVAVTGAQKLVDVAEKEKQTAAIQLDIATLEKQRNIELGTGEAERKRLILAADGALQQKLAAWSAAQEVWADAFARRQVPGVVMGASGAAGGDSDVPSFMQIMAGKAAMDLQVDMKMRSAADASANPTPAVPPRQATPPKPKQPTQGKETSKIVPTNPKRLNPLTGELAPEGKAWKPRYDDGRVAFELVEIAGR